MADLTQVLIIQQLLITDLFTQQPAVCVLFRHVCVSESEAHKAFSGFSLSAEKNTMRERASHGGTEGNEYINIPSYVPIYVRDGGKDRFSYVSQFFLCGIPCITTLTPN